MVMVFGVDRFGDESATEASFVRACVVRAPVYARAPFVSLAFTSFHLQQIAVV